MPSRSAPHLLLTYDFPPLRGGIARYMAEVARRYAPGRLVVSTGTHAGVGDADLGLPNRVDRLPMDAQKLRNAHGLLRWSRRARALARETGAEFVWCGNVRPAAYPAEWVRRREGTPYGVIFHGSDVLKLRRRAEQVRVKRWLYRPLLANAAVLAPNSRWTASQCHALLDALEIPLPRERVRVVPLGTDPAHFRPGLDTRAVRERYSLPEGRWLVTVARLAAEKGLDTGMRVLAALVADYPDLRYLIVVAGSTEPLPAFEREAVRLGVHDRIHFLAGVADADLPAVVNVGDVYLGLSRRTEIWEEGFGIALAEAAACGLPVVAGRSGGTAETVSEGETGILVDSESPDEAAAAVRTLLDDSALARRLGAAGRTAVERVYNWDRVAVDLTRIGEEFGIPPAGTAAVPPTERAG
jgi:phosphatidyl-myo-inositol dimannoside synthase